jgi:tetratricopeptide (TPR) repeat protein
VLVRRHSPGHQSLSVFCAVVALFAFLSSRNLSAQTGDHTLYGDLIIDESKVSGLKPLTFDVILYTEGKVLISRQSTANNGRFRFNNLPVGVYELAIEVENSEIARLSVDLRSPWLKEVRRNIELEWRLPNRRSQPGVVSVGNTYSRSSANQKLFTSARQAAEKKQYEKAAQLLQQITTVDEKDFEGWFELANIHFLQKKLAEAEKEYLRAIDAHSKFFLALLNLGRLELFQKHYDVAVQVLRRAVDVQPGSPEANYFLGEAYLQDKQGSLAVGYLNEAIKLEPVGMADAHLRLATLYNAVGRKDKAAAEYEEFLKKIPGYQDKKKLQEYITAHKKP